jgi:hypothetical protein
MNAICGLPPESTAALILDPGASNWHDPELTNITGIPPILGSRWLGPVGYAVASQGT